MNHHGYSEKITASTMTNKIVTGACNIRGDDCLDYLEARGENGKTISTK